jgi:type IV pilus assembly protein PilY1
VTDLTQGVTVPATSNGWYYDLPSGSRVVANPVAYNGVVAWATLIASTNACSPSGSSNVYAVDYSTGKSVLSPPLSTSTTPAVYQSFTTSITNLSFVSATSANSVELIAGQTSGTISKVPANLSGVVTTRMLNWVELPTAE